ncbi:MAG TPA: PRC and DUF2382 domain-containing protein [Segetibacter sp.]|jgi:uncharacterized protein (TIGR02271 family)
MATENINNTHLQELGGSDYEIADGQPNIKGWDIKDETGNKIGKVKELLFDPTTSKVRYIIAKLTEGDDRKVLIPIGIAQLHEDDDDVLLPGVTYAQLQSLPEYDKDNFTVDTEHTIRNVFAGVGGAAVAGAALPTDRENFYNHDHFNDENLYSKRSGKTSDTIPVIQEELQVGKREVETGGVRLRSRIVETPVQEDINLREEKVLVERTTVNRPANASDIREESVELTEKAEVPVVAKDARVVEEVSLNKDVTETERTISETVRNTEIDIEQLGNDRDETSRTRGI